MSISSRRRSWVGLFLGAVYAGLPAAQIHAAEHTSAVFYAADSVESSAKIDLNTASDKDLEQLPGVGAATAKKIIAGRPYTSVDGLAGAGISAKEIAKIKDLVTVGAPAAPPAPPAPAPPAKGAAAAPAEEMTEKVDLNSATDKELEKLPGVGAATAKKIIAGRPYTSVDGLAAAGISAKEIAKIKDLVEVGAPAPPTPPESTPAKGAPTAAGEPAGEAKVDLNGASLKDLEQLPGVGPATAKKIVAGRPYTSVDDLSKAGLTAKQIAKIKDAVEVGAPASETSAADETPTAQAPPEKGMVWVNLTSKVYHLEGDRYYGKTKNGKFMSEADAIKAGYTKAAKRGATTKKAMDDAN